VQNANALAAEKTGIFTKFPLKMPPINDISLGRIPDNGVSVRFVWLWHLNEAGSSDVRDDFECEPGDRGCCSNDPGDNTSRYRYRQNQGLNLP
jgi:hypothetical protein